MTGEGEECLLHVLVLKTSLANEEQWGREGKAAARKPSLLSQRGSSGGVGGGVRVWRNHVAELRWGRKIWQPGHCRRSGRYSLTLNVTASLHDWGWSDSQALASNIVGILNCHTFYKSSVHVCVLTSFCHVVVLYTESFIVSCHQAYQLLVLLDAMWKWEKAHITNSLIDLFILIEWVLTGHIYCIHWFSGIQLLGHEVERQTFYFFVSAVSSITFLLSPISPYNSSLANINSSPLHSRLYFRHLQYNNDQNTAPVLIS